jgi:hypothetical protein
MAGFVPASAGACLTFAVIAPERAVVVNRY